MGGPPNLYKLLECEKNATPIEIRRKFRELARKFHLDKNNSPDAKSIFQEINNAYVTLSNPTSRREYDRKNGIRHEDYEIVEYQVKTTANITSLTVHFSGDTDIWVKACQQFYGSKGVERGIHGVQFKGPFVTLPSEVPFGTISVTLYNHNVRRRPCFLVQGSSYMLWEAEHLPVLIEKVKQLSGKSSLLPSRPIRSKSQIVQTLTDSSYTCLTCEETSETLLQCSICQQHMHDTCKVFNKDHGVCEDCSDIPLSQSPQSSRSDSTHDSTNEQVVDTCNDVSLSQSIPPSPSNVSHHQELHSSTKSTHGSNSEPMVDTHSDVPLSQPIS